MLGCVQKMYVCINIACCYPDGLCLSTYVWICVCMCIMYNVCIVSVHIYVIIDTLLYIPNIFGRSSELSDEFS